MEVFARIRYFEEVVDKAIERKYAGTPELLDSVLRELRFGAWRPLPFVDVYRKASIYPEERLIGCLYHIIDVKLQFYLLLEVDLGMYNTQIYDHGFNQKDPSLTPDLFLRHLSFDQTLIIKSRILWERIINFVYFLETGEELERKISGKKSKRKAFFQFVESHPKWTFLEPYAAELDAFDQQYRGPEVHKASTLRAHLLKNTVPNTQDLLLLLNRAMSTIWPNVLSIVAGHRPSVFTDLHLSSDGHTVDPKYAFPGDGAEK